MSDYCGCLTCKHFSALKCVEALCRCCGAVSYSHVDYNEPERPIQRGVYPRGDPPRERERPVAIIA